MPEDPCESLRKLNGISPDPTTGETTTSKHEIKSPVIKIPWYELGADKAQSEDRTAFVSVAFRDQVRLQDQVDAWRLAFYSVNTIKSPHHPKPKHNMPLWLARIFNKWFDVWAKSAWVRRQPQKRQLWLGALIEDFGNWSGMWKAFDVLRTEKKWIESSQNLYAPSGGYLLSVEATKELMRITSFMYYWEMERRDIAALIERLEKFHA